MDKRIVKSQDILKRGYFSRLPVCDNKIEPEFRLWRTVLDLSLSDLLKGKSNFRDDVSVTWDGLIDWFAVSGYDFMMVCELAGLDSNMVYKKMTKVVTSI